MSAERCPRCGDAYMERCYLGAIAAERCPACMGHWLGRGDLVTFLKLPTIGYYAEQAAGLRIPVVAATQALSCPTCGVSLRRSRPAQLKQAAVDACPRCGGTWLDGVEYQRMLVAHVKGKGLLAWVLETLENALDLALWRRRP